MKNDIDLNKFKSWYETEPFEDFVGPFYYLEEDNNNISAFKCKKNHLNSMGSLHGGMIMSFIDYTLFVVSLDKIKKDSFVTISCNTEFLRPSIDDDIIFNILFFIMKRDYNIYIHNSVVKRKLANY